MERITLDRFKKHIFNHDKLIIDSKHLQKLSESYAFLSDFSKDKIIYGINTGFGPMVQIKIEPDDLNQLQYNLIRSHATGLGKPLPEIYAKSVVLARLNNFLQGNSGVSEKVIKQLQLFLNHNIIPFIPEHGGVGASGDLVQLAHLGLNLIGEGEVFYQEKLQPAKKVLAELNIPPLKLQLRDGLGIINGTSCMTGIGAINLIYAQQLVKLAVAASSIINEINDSFSDSFSKELNETKLHKGQNNIAQQMRNFLSGSKLIKNRKDLFNDTDEFNRKKFKKTIQEYYSLRCVPQILGPVSDTIEYAKNVIENELNSTSDNPIISPENNNVFHGGNFHGDYVALEMDKLRIVITKISMLIERQLNYLLNDKLNKKFPPFLNGAKLGLNFGIQGMQFTATSTTAENQTLATPMYIHSIPNNNDNQDVVSMGTNSALLTKKVIENTFQVIAIHFISLCQAIDLLNDTDKKELAEKTKYIYSEIRKKIDFVTTDKPLYENINKVIELLKTIEL